MKFIELEILFKAGDDNVDYESLGIKVKEETSFRICYVDRDSIGWFHHSAENEKETIIHFKYHDDYCVANITARDLHKKLMCR